MSKVNKMRDAEGRLVDGFKMSDLLEESLQKREKLLLEDPEKYMWNMLKYERAMIKCRTQTDRMRAAAKFMDETFERFSRVLKESL